MTTATIENLRGSLERVTIPAAIWEGKAILSAGVTLEGLYRGPRTGRMFARYYSIWARCDGSGLVEGESYNELDAQSYLRLCRVADVEPVGVQSEAA